MIPSTEQINHCIGFYLQLIPIPPNKVKRFRNAMTRLITDDSITIVGIDEVPHATLRYALEEIDEPLSIVPNTLVHFVMGNDECSVFRDGQTKTYP